MKKIFFLISTALLFAACSDDNDSNPTLHMPDSFVLNTPAIAQLNTDLATTDSVTYTWSQPDFGGWPAAAEYQLQFSLTNAWTQEYDESADDNTGANYYTNDAYYTTCSASLSGDEIMTIMQKLGGWAEGEVPANQVLYVRAVSQIIGYSTLSTSEKIYSNVISMNTVPYYVELKAAAPEIWYLTGGCIADGSWSNSADAIGTGMLPMFPVYGNTYDKNGLGIIEYYGYFPDNANFKIIAPKGLSNWNYGICGDGTSCGTTYRDGGDDPGNIWIETGGYYKIQVNTADCTCTIEPYDGSVTVVSPMYITGAWDEWSVATEMTAMETCDGAENHNWKYTGTISGETKFTNSGWSFNFGATEFPYGIGTNGGANIPVEDGNYDVYLNDISGQYYFIAK